MGKFIQINDANWKIPYIGGWCEGYVEGAWGQATLPTINNQTTSGVYSSATAAWNAQPIKHYDYPPANITVPVYFSLGSTEYGHVAIRLDDLMVASSTQGGFHSRGFIHSTIQNLIDVYAKYNNGCTYLGWGEYVGNIRVVEYVPDITTKEVTEELALPFESLQKYDPFLPKGNIDKINGVNGKITRIFTVTYSDGVQINKVLKSETRLEPITEEYITGTYELPIEPETPVIEPVKAKPTISELINKLVQLITDLIKRLKGTK